MRIFLVGYMGSGKSTLGRTVAHKLGLDFVDMDRYIEWKKGKSVPSIFAEEGEAGFRKIEKQALKALSLRKNIVISTGGGTPCYFDNMDFMNSCGITVYLNVPPEELAERLSTAKKERPLIKNKGMDELTAFIKEGLEIRHKYYSKSHIVLEGPEITTDEIIDKLYGL